MSEAKYICLLGIDPKEVQKCNASECPTCGWEAAEAERRRAYLREHGLTLCADGLRRLIIPKNGGNEEMKYKVCDRCGSHLDYGETCECVKEPEQEERGRGMLEIRRIKTDRFRTAAFWIEKRDNEYIACRTLVNALLRIASPSIMSVGQEALKKAYETRRI